MEVDHSGTIRLLDPETRLERLGGAVAP